MRLRFELRFELRFSFQYIARTGNRNCHLKTVLAFENIFAIKRNFWLPFQVVNIHCNQKQKREIGSYDYVTLGTCSCSPVDAVKVVSICIVIKNSLSKPNTLVFTDVLNLKF